jgi:hypothetical protein
MESSEERDKVFPFLAPSSSSSRISENITFSTSSPIPIPEDNFHSFQKIVVEDFEEEDFEDHEVQDFEDHEVQDFEDHEVQEEIEFEDIDISDSNLTSNLDSPTPRVESLFQLVEESNGINAPGMVEVEVDLSSSLSIPVLPQEEIHSEEIEIQIENKSTQEIQTEEEIDIKNLSLQQLRQIVSNKGLSTNPNKMKKQELIHLLQKPSTEKSLQDLAFLL